MERINRKHERYVYLPRLQLAVRRRGEYNRGMENKETDLQTLDKLAQAVEYFSLQYTSDGWYLSFVSRGSGEPNEFVREDLTELVKEASSLVFPPESV